jgi:hypothetical protein
MSPTCAWRNSNSPIVSKVYLLQPSSRDINLGQHVRCHFPDFPPTHYHGQAITAGWQSSYHRREPAPETAADYSQQIKAAGSQSISPGPRATRILGGMVLLQSNPQTEKLSASINIDGRSTAEACLNFRWQLELGFRQGHLRNRFLLRNKNQSPQERRQPMSIVYCAPASDFCGRSAVNVCFETVNSDVAKW